MHWRAELLVVSAVLGACASVVPAPTPELLAEREDLGARLFFDPALSRNRNVSCATCHQPGRAMADGLASSPGTHGGLQPRNTPALYNLANARTFFWDGRAESLEEQAMGPIEGPTEMDLPRRELEARLNTDASYVADFARAFPGAGLITADQVVSAIASFERTLRVKPSAFDAFQAGNTDALSPEAKVGLTVFEGRGLCTKCHKGVELTDGEFHNTGLITSDLGRGRVVRDSPSSRGTKGLSPYPFISHYKAFKTPTLRNVAQTAPYFHDGSRKTLREVIDFYDRGGDGSDQGKSLLVRPLALSEAEKAGLEALLNAMTSEVESVALSRRAHREALSAN